AGLEVDKNDPCRLRYAEIIGQDWSAIEEGFFSYAIADAIVTRIAYAGLRSRAAALAQRHAGKDVWDDAGERFGLLTETVQVKKGIGLAAIMRNGMAVDRGWAKAGEGDLRQRLAAAVSEVRALCPDLYKVTKDGGLITTKTGGPSKNQKALTARLATVKEEI